MGTLDIKLLTSASRNAIRDKYSNIKVIDVAVRKTTSITTSVRNVYSAQTIPKDLILLLICANA